MTTFRRILVATDFGAAARTACDDAVRLAKLFEGQLDLFHVEPIRTSASQGDVAAEAWAGLEHVRDALVAAGARVRELVVARGSAAEAILHGADKLDASAIVIGAGDRARSERATGATAETVARFARVPVWVARHESTLARVLCAVDHSEASREALRVAREVATRAQAALSVVHVLGNHETTPTPLAARDEARVLEELASFLELGRELGIVSVRGRPSEALVELARKDATELLVLGRGGVGGLRHVFMGGTAERLLRRAPCSLLLTSPRSAQ